MKACSVRAALVAAAIAAGGPALGACEYASMDFGEGAALSLGPDEAGAAVCRRGVWQSVEGVLPALCIYESEAFSDGAQMITGTYILQCENGRWRAIANAAGEGSR